MSFFQLVNGLDGVYTTELGSATSSYQREEESLAVDAHCLPTSTIASPPPAAITVANRPHGQLALRSHR